MSVPGIRPAECERQPRLAGCAQRAPRPPGRRCGSALGRPRRGDSLRDLPREHSGGRSSQDPSGSTQRDVDTPRERSRLDVAGQVDAEEGARVPERERDSRQDFQAALRARATVVDPRPERSPRWPRKTRRRRLRLHPWWLSQRYSKRLRRTVRSSRQIRVSRIDRGGDIHRMVEDHNPRARERDVVRAGLPHGRSPAQRARKERSQGGIPARAGT